MGGHDERGTWHESDHQFGVMGALGSRMGFEARQAVSWVWYTYMKNLEVDVPPTVHMGDNCSMHMIM